MEGLLNEIQKKDDSQKSTPDFRYLIAPLTFKTFEDSYFEKKHFHIARKNPDYYQQILNITDLERTLFEQVPRFPSVRLTNAKEDIASEKYVGGDSKINTTALLKYFAEGSTIVMSGHHEFNSGLGQLVSMLSKFFYHKFQTNIYITPKNSQGFKVHYDTHDVFILQIYGKKNWKIYADNPLELPNKMQEFEPGKYEPGPLLEELELNAGDILYLPRGVMHQAETNDALSIHVTLGWLGFTWADLVIESILEESKKNKELRQFLPHNMLMKGVGDNHKEEFKQLLLRLAEQLSLPESVIRFKRELAITQKPNIEKLLQTGDEIAKITTHTLFKLRKNVLFFTKKNKSTIRLEWLGKEVEFPIYTTEAIEYISKNNQVFGIPDIPDCIDDEGKIVLVTRLVKEGLIQIESI